MLAGLEDVDCGGFPRASFGYDVALFEGPLGESALYGRVPCAEPELVAPIWRDMGEGVVKKARAALYVGVGLDGERDELDGVGEGGWEIEFGRGAHGRRLGVERRRGMCREDAISARAVIASKYPVCCSQSQLERAGLVPTPATRPGDASLLSPVWLSPSWHSTSSQHLLLFPDNHGQALSTVSLQPSSDTVRARQILRASMTSLSRCFLH